MLEGSNLACLLYRVQIQSHLRLSAWLSLSHSLAHRWVDTPHDTGKTPIDSFCPTPSNKFEKDLIPTTLESFVELAIHDLISA